MFSLNIIWDKKEKRGLIIISEQVYKGLAPEKDHEKLILALDGIFNDGEPYFLELLPKLYKTEYHPCANNFVVKEGDEIKGAVGRFYGNVCVCGETLKYGGIGNVGVTVDSRSKGYMIECMNMAMTDMIENKADFSFLGGQRQRYGYFSFEPAGVSYDFSVNKNNLRHCFGKDYKCRFETVKLTPDNTSALEEIEKLFRSEQFYVPHDLEDLFDILCSWSAVPYILLDKGTFKGFFTTSRGMDNITNFKAVDEESLRELIFAAMDTIGVDRLSFRTPAFYKDAISFFTVVAENMSMSHAEHFTVLNFENVCRAFLKLQSSIKKLCTGSVVLLIHGYNGDEKLELSVSGGTAAVAKSDKAPDMELTHHEAIRLLFSLFPDERTKLSPEVQQWLPLPLYGYPCDGV